MTQCQPHPDRPDSPPVKRDHPIPARVLRRWRHLTGGSSTRDHQRQTLVACSGGRDSVALAYILSLVTPKPIIAHIVHDIRSTEHTHADRDAAQDLAHRLGCEFITQEVPIAHLQGNHESNARSHRYNALSTIASAHNIAYIATAHHADDQLETMLMHLHRGTSPRGFAGIHPARTLNTTTIIRPMLTTTRDEIDELCVLANLPFQHDHTNDDRSLTRNKIRHDLVPAHKAIEPESARRASHLADSIRESSDALDHLVTTYILKAATTTSDTYSWTRPQLRDHPIGVLTTLLYQCATILSNKTDLDKLTRRTLTETAQHIQDPSTDPRLCRLGPIVVNIDAHQVIVRSASDQFSDHSSSKEPTP